MRPLCRKSRLNLSVRKPASALCLGHHAAHFGFIRSSCIRLTGAWLELQTCVSLMCLPNTRDCGRTLQRLQGEIIGLERHRKHLLSDVTPRRAASDTHQPPTADPLLTAPTHNQHTAHSQHNSDVNIRCQQRPSSSVRHTSHFTLHSATKHSQSQVFKIDFC